MASKKIPYLQDMPPQGGYGPISYEKKVLKQWPGWLKLTAFTGFSATFIYLYLKDNQIKRAKQIEIKDSHIALEPLFKAEDDRTIMKIKRRNRDLENEIMKNVPDWETGTLWGTPLYYTKNTRVEMPENSAELNAHSPTLKDKDFYEIR